MSRMKMLPLALVGTLALSVLAAGCTSKSAGGSSSAGSSAGSGTTPAAAGGGAKPADTKTITYQFLRNFAAPDYPADGGEGHVEVVKAAEKAGITGFDFKSTLASGDDYNTKLNLLATSGQLPDLIDIDPKTLARFVDQGLVQPLDDYLKKSPNIMKVVPAAYWNQVKFNGKIYAIPNGTRPETFNYPSVNGLDIRQDWLDALGLKQPTNLNELHDVLKAFVTQDPDKDGKNDTVGLASHKDTSQGKSTVFSGIFGAFGVIPNFWTERDGMIKKGFTLPETKQALTVLQQWYKEGLIDHDFPIMEVKQMDEKVANSITGVWDGDGYYTEKGSNPPAEALNKANPKAVVRMLVAPLGPSGKQGYAEANAFAVSPLRALSVKAQDPAKLFQYLDWSATEAGHNLITYGVEGKDFTYDKATNTINQSVSYADLYKRGFSNPIRMIFITDRRWAKQPVRDAIDIVNQHLVKNAMWNIVPAENDYPDLESKLWQEYFVKIVTGEWSVDKWDEFVQKYYAQGGKEIEKQANDLYKQLNAK